MVRVEQPMMAAASPIGSQSARSVSVMSHRQSDSRMAETFHVPRRRRRTTTTTTTTTKFL
jgi:hypothetical protein